MRKTPGGPVTAVVLNMGFDSGRGTTISTEIDMTPEEADKLADRLHEYADLVRSGWTGVG
jgi:hypothetical protein